MSSYHYSLYSPHRFHCCSIFSHRFHRSTQNFLLRMFSHRFHRFTQKLGCLQGGALVSSAPTKQEVHQPSKIDILPRNPQNPQNCLLSVFSHRLHRLTQNFLLSVSSHRFHRSTQMVRLRKIVAEVSLPPQLQSDFHRWHRCNFRGCTSCSVGALETSAPPEISRFCEFREFCGRIFRTLTICVDL